MCALGTLTVPRGTPDTICSMHKPAAEAPDAAVPLEYDLICANQTCVGLTSQDLVTRHQFSNSSFVPVATKRCDSC